MTDYNAILSAKLEPAINDWFRRQCLNPSESMFLYFKPQHCAFWIGEHPLNDDWELASPLRVSPAKTKEQVMYWAHELSRTLPVLSPED